MQPGREYKWAVQAIDGTTLGPITGYGYFFTSPMCDTAALAASSLLQPTNGAIINNLDPSLIWQYLDACRMGTGWIFRPTPLSRIPA